MTELQETAVIQIRPAVDPRVVALYEEGVRLKEYAIARWIQSDSDIKGATDDLSIIAKLKKAIEEKRKEYVNPINEHLKAVNSAFKTFVDPIEQADLITREKIRDYRREQERVRLEQERINRLRMEAAQAEMQLKGELTEPVSLVDVAPVAPAHFRTESGTLGTAKIKKWEVEDLSKVPIDYLMVDAAKVGKVVRAGISSIPGIRIWEEEGLRVTTR